MKNDIQLKKFCCRVIRSGGREDPNYFRNWICTFKTDNKREALIEFLNRFTPSGVSYKILDDVAEEIWQQRIRLNLKNDHYMYWVEFIDTNIDIIHRQTFKIWYCT